MQNWPDFVLFKGIKCHITKRCVIWNEQSSHKYNVGKNAPNQNALTILFALKLQQEGS